MKNSRGNRVFFAVTLACAAWLARALPAEGQAQPIPHGTLSLLSESGSIQPGHATTLAFQFSMEKGWHVYWVNPGDSGEPPRVKWDLPQGISAGPIEWPAPVRLSSTPTIVDYGYEDKVTLLVPLSVSSSFSSPAAPLKANVNLLICRDVCIPGKAQLSLSLPVGPKAATASGNSAVFTEARSHLPLKAPTTWAFTVNDSKGSFFLTGRVGKSTTQAYFFPMDESQIENSAPQAAKPTPTGFSLALHKSPQLAKSVVHLRGVLLLDGARAYSVDVPVTGASPKVTAKPPGNS
jgi:thiol:disulfide interchange protein DsbD